ncbi:MAG: helix-turn-helix domain-containing protein, partial [Gammaproteobacteria bacterium]|nr:helix-turn-helix domain-containing protein [Gammaproteobacteria bacterium]
RIRATGGISIDVSHSARMLDAADTIIIPGWRDPLEAPPAALLTRLRRAHLRGARLCSICSGVFVLAAAGLLDGKRATTHWRLVRLLTEMYPRIQVDSNALYVDEGSVLTSAGSAAGLDMLIHLIRKDHGARIANQVARRLVIPPHRQGGQAQFVVRPVPRDERGRLARLQDWLREHLDQEISVPAMARRASISPRSLQREFKAATGESAYEWLLRERIELARELLERRSIPLRDIPAHVGISSQESFRHHFRKHVGTTPSAYRARFASGEHRPRFSAPRN